MPRLEHIIEFYGVLDELCRRVGCTRTLGESNGRMAWPKRGVYFFFEENELRSQSGRGFRVTRIGTHAVSRGSKTSLWKRLNQHKGYVRGKHHDGGNHRGSIFRKLIGQALIQRENMSCPTWGVGNSASGYIHEEEHTIEVKVSGIIRSMPFVFVEADDEPWAHSIRSHIEKGAICLLSNFNSAENEKIDPPSARWLGRHCPNNYIPQSGLWQSEHVKGHWDKESSQEFLAKFRELVDNVPIL